MGLPKMMLLVVVGIGVLVLVISVAIEAEKRRRRRIEAMRAFAESRGLSFSADRDTRHDDEYAHFELFRRGFDRAAYNTIQGRTRLGDAEVFVKMGDFVYKTRETSTTTVNGRVQTRTRIVRHYFSYLIMELPFDAVPDLLIRREGWFDKVASAFGHNDIDFESAAFSREFFVQSESRKFAYDIIHPRMIEFLMETRPGLVDIEHSRICLTNGDRVWEAARFARALDWTCRFVELWPAFVVKDLAEGRVV